MSQLDQLQEEIKKFKAPVIIKTEGTDWTDDDFLETTVTVVTKTYQSRQEVEVEKAKAQEVVDSRDELLGRP